MPDPKDKSRVTIYLDRSLIERARNACAALPQFTLTEVLAGGIEKAVSALEARHNKGRPFKTRRSARLRPGKRIR